MDLSKTGRTQNNINVSQMMNSIVDEFVEYLKDYRKENRITDDDLKNHDKSNIHSWLQYLMIKSGEKNGLLTPPEIKLRFDEPFNPNGERNRNFRKVDVAFYDSKSLVGVAEIITMDGAHEILGRPFWSTPDILLHTIEHVKPKLEFIILVVILMKKTSRIYWRTNRLEIDSKLEENKNYYCAFKNYWQEFKKKIKIDNALLIINEVGIEKFL
jgi:hypothetical protein